jgi:hypothetical protein
MSNTRTTRARTTRSKPADTITFMDGSYKVAGKVGVWPQMMLARAAQDGVMLGDMRGLAAVHAMLENVIDPEDWPRFQEDMIKKKADDLSELLDAVTQALQVVSERQGSPVVAPAALNGKADAAVPGSLQVR